MNEIIIDIKANPTHQRIRVYDRLVKRDESIDFVEFNEIVDSLLDLGIFVQCRSINNTEPEGYFFGLKIPTVEEAKETKFVHTSFEAPEEDLLDLFDWDDSDETTQKYSEATEDFESTLDFETPAEGYVLSSFVEEVTEDLTFPLPKNYTPNPESIREQLMIEIGILDQMIAETKQMDSSLRGCEVVSFGELEDSWFI